MGDYRLKPQGSQLLIYDAAPDVPERQLLTFHPFPVKEPVLPRPTTRIPTEETEATAPATEENIGPGDILPHQSGAADALPVNGRTRLLIAAMVRPTEKLLLAALARTAKIIHDVAGTMY